MATQFFSENGELRNRTINTGAVITGTVFGTLDLATIMILIFSNTGPTSKAVMIVAGVVFTLAFVFCMIMIITRETMQGFGNVLYEESKKLGEFYEQYPKLSLAGFCVLAAISLIVGITSMVLLASQPREYDYIAFPLLILSPFGFAPLVAAFRV